MGSLPHARAIDAEQASFPVYTATTGVPAETDVETKEHSATTTCSTGKLTRKRSIGRPT